MKQLVKSLMYAIAPRWATSFMSARARAHSHKIIRQCGRQELNQKLLARVGNDVQSGPFAGLLLSPMTHAEDVGPYLLGVYESELDPAWNVILDRTYSQIVDVGAKFGYYAVGLAKRYPKSAVIAFDTDSWARQAIHEMAAVNGVNNVIIQDYCSPSWIQYNLSANSLVICDCEGYEDMLFGNALMDSLSTTTLIIETHDFIVSGVTDRLRDAFNKTHIVRTIDGSAARRIRTEGLEFLSQREQALVNLELRPPPVWLLCLPKNV